MVVKKKPMLYLDITKPNTGNNFYIINSKNKLIGEVPAEEYREHSEKYLTDEMTPITYTGYRKKKGDKVKSKRKTKKKDCGCK
jgi:hypothetical protein